MLYIEPSDGPAPIVQVIDQARHSVDLNVYYLSSRPIMAALKAARARGVDVRVILDGKPYGMKPWQVSKEFRTVAALGVQVHQAPARFEAPYVYDHAKYVCNGHECEIGTANFDWSAFHRNREYLYVTKNPAVVTAAQDVFAADWNNRRAPASAHRVLVLSPGTSAAQLLQVINQPGPIDVESEELGPYQPILNALAAKGKDLRLILPASINEQDKRDVAFLQSHGCHVRLLPKKPIYMHAKMIVGQRLAFVGSENFTQTSLENNREMGLILGGSDLAKLKAQFDRDWTKADV
ncbi:GTP-binding protein [Acidithiobacillus sp. CV18-2]|nr:GTP-binding protein [Acidithiobacillus sp. CV18-3]MBU2756960.1 GTP-binding protein [Acidithiobacillus sp. BN09-2]MBU2777571.1 GTP-binding protein [Acidithiobacillus sp. CV18-2]MBU2799671.1 GTP-binding protein [Acidithiobacillus sp. VAN18-4]